MRRRFLVTLLGLAAIAALSGCSNNPTSTSLGTMSVQLTDAPGDFQAVNLVVTQVAAQRSNGNGGWEVLQSGTRTYDLLKLRNGVFSAMGISQLPAGVYDKLRLKLGTGSTVVVDNTIHPLRVSSEQQSGLILQGQDQFVVPKSGRVDLALDFNVARSIKPKGDGSYMIKPCIRIVVISVPENKPGSIHGTVLPGGVMSSVYAIVGPDTVASTMPAADGQFTIVLLPAGTYQLAFHPREAYQDQTLGGVVVAMGQVTEVATVNLTPIPPPPPTQGAIAGHVVPPGVPTMVSAISAGSIVAQVAVSVDGAFMLAGLPAGSFDLYVQPSSEFLEQTRSGIVVVAGQTNDIGAIQLQPVPPPPPPPPPPPQQPGAISGLVSPAGIPTSVSAMQGTTVVAQLSANMDGSFLLDLLPAGSYTVVVHPLFDFLDMTIPGVVVNPGATTNLGPLPLAY